MLSLQINECSGRRQQVKDRRDRQRHAGVPCFWDAQPASSYNYLQFDAFQHTCVFMLQRRIGRPWNRLRSTSIVAAPPKPYSSSRLGKFASGELIPATCEEVLAQGPKHEASISMKCCHNCDLRPFSIPRKSLVVRNLVHHCRLPQATNTKAICTSA